MILLWKVQSSTRSLDTEQDTKAAMISSTQHFVNTLPDGAADSGRGLEDPLPTLCHSLHEVYEFERRAIFSKRWLFISHESWIRQTGDWLRYSFASYDIIVTRDITEAINIFHNVCRHCAYPVIEKEGTGNNSILSCRYHGWSYGLTGNWQKLLDIK